jgi:putative molybdopterin biosynthesis protein
MTIMPQDRREPDKEFISAREVSILLDINEKKVYTLAQKGKIPGTKITGKWLFPKTELEQFLRRKATSTLRKFSTEYALSKNVLLVAGSDDPIMYPVQGMIHTLHPDFVLFLASVGSSEGLRLLSRSFCHIALSHLHDQETNDFTFPFLQMFFDDPAELAVINLFHRTVGFIAREEAVHSFSEIASKGLRFINRQVGSGIRRRIDLMLMEEQVEKNRIKGYTEEVNTHFSVVNHILSEKADAGVGTESVARYAHLHFTELFEERFDMVVHKESFFEQNVQVFVDFVHSDAFLELVANFKGYSNRDTGKIIYPKDHSMEGDTV